jgi:hypothetical protein
MEDTDELGRWNEGYIDTSVDTFKLGASVEPKVMKE